MIEETLIGVMGGACGAIICMSLYALYMDWRARRLGLVRRRPQAKLSKADIQRIESFCREMIAEALCKNDARWMKRILR